MSPPSVPVRATRKSRICPYCQRAFRRLEHLQRHVRLHTHEKPYTCACGEAFARRDLLRRHHSLVHGGIEPFSSSSTIAPGLHAKPLQANGNISTPSAIHRHESAVDHELLAQQVTNSFAAPVQEAGGVGNSIHSYQDPALYASSIYPSLEEFTGFIDSMGLGFDSDSLRNFDGIAPDQGLNAAFQDRSFYTLASEPDTAEEQIESGHRAQMPTLLPIPLNPWIQAAVYIPLLRITEAQRADMLHAFGPFKHLVPSFSLPSRESLTRFLNAYFDGVYLHLPFIHCASFSPEKHPLELVLAMAAAGAQYRYQHRTGRMLYFAAKAIFQERQRAKARGISRGEQLTAALPVTSGPFSSRPTITDDLRCLLNLMIFGTWQQDLELLRDACDFQSLFVRLMRESGLVEEGTSRSDVSNLNWQTWLELEATRRVKLFGFAFLNLQSIAYNLPPILLSTEINLRLPCTCDEWRTVNEMHWRQVRQNIHHEQNFFQDALASLLNDGKVMPASTTQPTPSPTASILTLHALLQRILLGRQAALCNNVPQADILTNALRNWTSTWQLAPESSLDPLNPNGPIPFTATALLGLAYTRLQIDLGPCRMLETRNPVEIARALHQTPPVSRDKNLLPALLHATHALSIPVKLGVEYVSRSQAFVWSIQHALCGLEFAVLVEKWLRQVEKTKEEQPLEEHERLLLGWIQRVVDEGRSSVDFEDDFLDNRDCNQLASFVVKLWARIMHGNEQWPFVDLIGQSLQLYASGADVVGGI